MEKSDYVRRSHHAKVAMEKFINDLENKVKFLKALQEHEHIPSKFKVINYFSCCKTNIGHDRVSTRKARKLSTNNESSSC